MIRSATGLDRAARFEARAGAHALAILGPETRPAGAPNRRRDWQGASDDRASGCARWASIRARPLAGNATLDARTLLCAALRGRRGRAAVRDAQLRPSLLRLSPRPLTRRRFATRAGRVRARPPSDRADGARLVDRRGRFSKPPFRRGLEIPVSSGSTIAGRLPPPTTTTTRGTRRFRGRGSKGHRTARVPERNHVGNAARYGGIGRGGPGSVPVPR